MERLDLVYFLRSGIEEWRRSGSGEVLRIDFCAAIRDWIERIEVRIHAVLAALKRKMGAALTPFIDSAAQWVGAAETSENVWRSTNHVFVLRCDIGGPTVQEQ